MVKSLWSLLFFKLNSPSSLPLHTGEMLQSLITCVVSHQTCSSISQSLGSAEVNSELWGCLSSAERKERITSFSLQAILFLVQPRMLLSALATGTHCWLMFSYLSSRILDASLPSCFPSRCWPPTPVCTGPWGCSSPGTGIYISFDWTSWGSSLLRSLWMAAQPSGIAVPHCRFVWSLILLRVYPAPSSRLMPRTPNMTKQNSLFCHPHTIWAHLFVASKIKTDQNMFRVLWP